MTARKFLLAYIHVQSGVTVKLKLGCQKRRQCNDLPNNIRVEDSFNLFRAMSIFSPSRNIIPSAQTTHLFLFLLQQERQRTIMSVTSARS